jgi:sugar lactone lactonase YvrE
MPSTEIILDIELRFKYAAVVFRTRRTTRPARHVRAQAVAACLIAILATATSAQARLEVHLFARVPFPGYPANEVVAADGTVYVGTFKSFTAPSDTGPSKVFAFSPSGRLERTYTITGQTPNTPHGIQVAATDRHRLLYLLDQAPPRIIRLNPATGAQSTWATFESLPACPGAPNGDCTDGLGGNPPEPDFATWGPDGSLYVTDYNQSLIWRVPPSGGKARVWFTNPLLNGYVVGPAGIELMADRHTLMLDTNGGGGIDPTTGKLYTLQIQPDGQPGALHEIWQSAPAQAPDGFAIARSGDIYVALVGPTGNAVIELSPGGTEIARVPTNPIANLLEPIPFDAPGSVAFAGDQLLVGNASTLQNDPSHMALLEINVGEPGLPLSLPPAKPAPPRYTLRVKPASVTAGRRIRFTFTAAVATSGGAHPVRQAMIRFAGRAARTSKSGKATITASLRQAHSPYRAVLIINEHRAAAVAVTTRS